MACPVALPHLIVRCMYESKDMYKCMYVGLCIYVCVLNLFFLISRGLSCFNYKDLPAKGRSVVAETSERSPLWMKVL